MQYSRPKRQKAKKKAMVFIIDAVLAALVIILGIILIRSYATADININTKDYSSQDIVKVLGNLKINEFNHPYVLGLINDSTIRYVNNSILEQIGEFWATGHDEEAKNISRILLGELVDSARGVGIFVDDEAIYVKNISTPPTRRWRQGRIISGIAKDKPVKGTVSRAFLRADPKKRTAYAFFGGYVGDGNITARIDLLSGLSNVTAMVFEGDIGRNFTLTINGDYAGSYTTEAIPRDADSYTISTSYLSSFQEGNNTLVIGFEDTTDNYIGGGYIRVDYVSAGTPETTPSLGMNVSETKYLPGIKGIINLYDAFSVPGNLTSLEAYLHFENEFFLKFTIGNTTVLLDNTTTTSIMLDAANLSYQLDLSSFDEKTVPIRLRSEIDSVGKGKGADVILITDLSGSMNWRIGYADSTYGTIRACDSTSLYNADTRRISVAKCLDKNFADILLNYSQYAQERNRIGLVGYTGVSPDGIVSFSNLTKELTDIHADIESYPDTTSGGTCIACAIDKAKELITLWFPVIERKSSWYYLTNVTAGVPLNDTQNNTWQDPAYNDSSWSSGRTIIGFPGAMTSISAGVAVDLWELGVDAPQPVDFTSGLNSTANTFGIGGADDGWDWQGGIYDYGSSATLNGVVGGALEIYFQGGTTERSAGYGILFNITQAVVDAIANGSSLMLSFDYEWDGNDDPFENSDHIWVKGRFHNPNSTVTYLGSELEGGDSEADATPEIDYRDNPDDDFSGTHTENLTGMIGSAGMYYLDLGGKLKHSAWNEWGYIRFDDISMSIEMPVGNLFLRKDFTIYGDSVIEGALLKVYSDDNAEVWLNGNLIDNESVSHTGQYWNRQVAVDPSNFVVGPNQVAVLLRNDDAESMAFDLELTINDSARVKHIITMTDGIPGYSYPPLASECGANAGDCNTGACNDARDSTIAASCAAHTETNATIHSVGFGDLASCTVANETLFGIASCGEGNYSSSDNASQLLEIYEQLALNIISQTFSEQTSFVEGTTANAVLYPDSYIRFNYTSTALPPVFGTAEITLETPAFGNNATIGNLTLPSQLTVVDAQVTSYSGTAWTDRVQVRNALYPTWTSIYLLSDWASIYDELGDPFKVGIAPQYFTSGLNEFRIETGLDPTAPENGSVDDKLIYTVRFDAAVNYSQITSSAEGCVWDLEFEDGTASSMPVPYDYAGANTCTFATAVYDSDDALQSAAFTLFSALDFDGDGKLYFNPDDVDLLLDQVEINEVPSLWGPTLVEVRVWE